MQRPTKHPPPQLTQTSPNLWKTLKKLITSRVRKKRPISSLTKTSRSRLNKRSMLPNGRSNKSKTHQMLVGECLKTRPKIMASLWRNQKLLKQTLLLARLARSTLRRVLHPNSKKSLKWKELTTISPTLKVKLSVSSKTEWVRKTAQILECLARRLSLPTPKATTTRKSVRKLPNQSLLAQRKKLWAVVTQSPTSKTVSKTTTSLAWVWANLALRPRRNVVKEAMLLKDSKKAVLARTTMRTSPNPLPNKFIRKRICPTSKWWKRSVVNAEERI